MLRRSDNAEKVIGITDQVEVLEDNSNKINEHDF